MSIPKVFISYSHDSLEHKKWVLDLGTRLRNNGIDAILDQWELSLGSDLPHFMETNLSSADHIIMVCTDRYVEKANGGTGGVGYEKMIVTSTLMRNINESKIIPILKQDGTYNLPTFLSSKLFVNFSKADDYEFSFDELIRSIHKAPIFNKPDIGNNPFLQGNVKVVDQPQNDALKELMGIIINNYEDGYNSITIPAIRNSLNVSRIMLESLVSRAEALGYVTVYDRTRVYLQDGGKKYAIENELIK